MKENIKSFFNEKKELFIFIGVVILVLGTVLGTGRKLNWKICRIFWIILVRIQG